MRQTASLRYKRCDCVFGGSITTGSRVKSGVTESRRADSPPPAVCSGGRQSRVLLFDLPTHHSGTQAGDHMRFHHVHGIPVCFRDTGGHPLELITPGAWRITIEFRKSNVADNTRRCWTDVVECHGWLTVGNRVGWTAATRGGGSPPATARFCRF